MPCYSQDNVPDGYIAKFPDGPTYQSEEDCLDACAEGACCETDGTCNIKPQCECDTDNGAVFAGVGETCEACKPCFFSGGFEENCGEGKTFPESVDIRFHAPIDGQYPNPNIGGPRYFAMAQSCVDEMNSHLQEIAGITVSCNKTTPLADVLSGYSAQYTGVASGSGWTANFLVTLFCEANTLGNVYHTIEGSIVFDPGEPCISDQLVQPSTDGKFRSSTIVHGFRFEFDHGYVGTGGWRGSDLDCDLYSQGGLTIDADTIVFRFLGTRGPNVVPGYWDGSGGGVATRGGYGPSLFATLLGFDTNPLP
jgi:hypothetical protein